MKNNLRNGHTAFIEENTHTHTQNLELGESKSGQIDDFENPFHVNYPQLVNVGSE